MKDILYKNILDYENKFINPKEIENTVLKLGSFLSIIYNKKLSPIKLVSILINESNIRNIFYQLTGINNFLLMLKELLSIYPKLCRSQIIKKQLKIYKKNKNDRKRKKHL